MLQRNKKYEVVIVGQFTLDDVVSSELPTRIDSPGGDGLYSLAGVYLWRRGNTGLVIRLGEDFDIDVIKKIVDDSVDFSGVVNIPGVPNIHIWNMFDRYGHRYFINQRWGGQDEDMAPRPEDIPEEYIDDSLGIHIAPFPIEWSIPMIESMPLNGTSDLIVQVDPHFDGIFKKNFGIWKKLLKRIDIFQPSEVEFMQFFGIEKQSDVRGYIKYMREVTKMGPRVCCVKLGDRGAISYDRLTGEVFCVPAYDSQVVDVTGCGDSFCGGFLSSYVSDQDIYNAMVCGAISASFNIEKFGSIHNFSIDPEIVYDRYKTFSDELEKVDCRIIY